MPFATVRGLNMYYEVHGSGPGLLFVGGTGGDLRQKPNISDSPLTAAFTVLAYDQRGLGRTDAPDGPYTMADYAEDANALLDAVAWESCHIVGASFGGMVAQEFAIRFPSRVQRLVLACTSSGGAGAASYPLHELAGLDVRERAKRVVLLSDTRRHTEWMSTHSSEFEALIQQAMARATVGAGEPDRESGWRWQLEARRRHDTHDRLQSLSMPVYICGGKYDGIAPVDNSKALARQIPGACLEFFEGGHLFLREDPRAFPRIVAFLRGEMAEENK